MVNQRIFQLVDYGASAPADALRPTIACDGRVPGCTMELTHWTDNKTPDEYYADTSTEMALSLPLTVYENALILNNHFDTDGVLSVFACLQPELAREYRDLLIEGAEAGDFGEWSSDVGIKLDLTVGSFCVNDEASAYEAALAELPDLLKDLRVTGGEAYRERWQSGFDRARQSYQAFQDGQATVRAGPRGIALVEEPHRLDSYALHRALVDADLYATTDRILRYTTGTSSFVYEKPGYGWVQRLRDRRPVPPGNVLALVQILNQRPGMEDCWKAGGPSGLVAICKAEGVDLDVEEVAHTLADLDLTRLQEA